MDEGNHPPDHAGGENDGHGFAQVGELFHHDHEVGDEEYQQCGIAEAGVGQGKLRRAVGGGQYRCGGDEYRNQAYGNWSKEWHRCPFP
jgi:hypothetical protein